MIQYIKTFIYGVAAKGVPVSSIRSTVHTVQPDVQVPKTEMHLVIWNALEEVRKKLAEVN